MNKICFTGCVATILGSIFSVGAAQSVWSVRPEQLPEFPKFCEVWLAGGDTVETNIPMATREDGFSTQQLYFFGAEYPAQRYYAIYDFEIPESGEYRFGAALVHQGANYASPVRYRFDREGFQAVPEGNRSASWGFAGAVGWSDLGSHFFDAGQHRLEFEFDAKADNGNWSFLCDGIAGLRVDDAKNAPTVSAVNVVSGALVPGGEMLLEFDCAGSLQPLRVRLESTPEFPVTEAVVIPVAGRNQVALPLPQHLGAGRYQVSFYAGILGSQPLNPPLAVAVAENLTAPPALALKSAVIDGDTCIVELAEPAPAALKLCVMLEIDGVVYAVETIEAPMNAERVSAIFSPEWRQAAAGREAEAVFRGAPGKDANLLRVPVRMAGEPATLPKPMNYGVFVDRFGLAHPWYMDHAYRYNFDGEPYYPVGAMWCTQTLRNSTSADDQIARNFAFDMEFLDRMTGYEIDDFYFNQALSAPLFVRQFFVDEMERRKINYAWQLTIGESEPVASYFITRDAPGRANHRDLARGIYRDGAVEFELSPEYKAIGALVVPAARDQVFSLSFDDQEGRDTRSAVIDLDRGKDHAKSRRLRIVADLPLADGTELVVIPKLAARMSHPNLLDDSYRERAYEQVAWIKAINWGPHFRYIVDPGYNETHMTNGTENLRQYTDAVNSRFAAWLVRRYGDDLDALNAAWQTEVADWDAASRLVPLRLEENLYLCDPETGDLYESDLAESQMWPDYNEMVRSEYALEADRFAQHIKTLVDIPVVYKSVEAQGSMVMRSMLYGGFDGVGSEVYLNQALPPEGAGGGAKAAAEASSHTVWKVATELGHDAQIGNGGVQFFADGEEIHGLAREMAKLGISGYYFFGAHLGDDLWTPHTFYDLPQGMEWLREINARQYPLTERPAPRNYLFPGGHSWWWWITRNFALYDRERSEIAVSLRLPDGEWATNTEVMPEDWSLVVVNCPAPPFSARYADEIEALAESGRDFIYLGAREDLGVIPAVDDYYTDTLITFADGTTAQELKVPAGAEVLAAEGGRAWALLDGKRLIVSRTPICQEAYVTQNVRLEHLKPEWLARLRANR